MLETYDLTGRHALVCGASRGIGRAVAETLAARGATLTLVARDADHLASVTAGLAGDRDHGYLALDLSDADSIPPAVERAIAERGPVHILVNNAGGPPAGPAHEAGLDAFRRAFELHLIADQALLRSVLAGMREAGWGRVINIISTSVYEPIPGLGVSNTIRGAVASWAKTLSKELGPDGITVNNVLPGFTNTDRLMQLFGSRAEREERSFESVRDAALAQVPAGRFAEPYETAEAVAFLASPAADYISGVSLPVDGGRLARI